MNPNYLAVLQALSQLPRPRNEAQIAPDTLPAPSILSSPRLEPPPMAPSMPIDQNIVNRYLAMIGPAPNAPTPQPVGKLERIATALQAFSAGVQGQGPQFLAAIREQRERPQREFEEARARYDQQKLQLGLRGMEAAQSAEEKRQARQQAEADRQFELDVKERARQLGLQDEKEIALFRDALTEKRERERRQAESEAAEVEAQAKMERDIRAQADRLFDDFKGAGGGISRAQAIRFAKYEVLGEPLTAQDQKAYSRTVAPTKQGVAGDSAKNKLARFEVLKGQLGAARARGDVETERNILRNLDALAAKMPSYIETGYDPSGMWPYAKVRGTNPQPPQQSAPPAPPATESPNRSAARAKLVANGYSDAEATQELDRLGIK